MGTIKAKVVADVAPSTTWTICLVLAGLSLRTIISDHPYSGHAKPPMFGDFEAQRHWQEITIHLRIGEWYENSTRNDLNYWGLDYPPLTAYHSWSMGWAAQYLNPEFTALFQSRGITNSTHKFFMRSTVLLADALIFIPAMLICCKSIIRTFGLDPSHRMLHLAIVLLYPGQILIDNGHFQYNNISLALSMLAVCSLISRRPLLGCLLFSLALNYKQMVLYYALPVFVHLLGHCFRALEWSEVVKRFVHKGLVVISVFGVLWAPWLTSPAAALQVLHRVFPVARGVFEDKVANIWCVVNVVFPLKELVSNERMAFICMLCTLLASFPSLAALWKHSSGPQLLLAVINTSLAFFLLSFQVHEKTILLVALPVALYFPVDPLPSLLFLQVATFSMLPLLRQDNLVLPTVVLCLIYLIVVRIVNNCLQSHRPNAKSPKWDFLLLRLLQATSSIYLPLLFYATLAMQCALGSLLVFAQPPPRLPHLFPLLIAATSAAYFGAFFLYWNWRQWFGVSTAKRSDLSKRL